MKRFYILTSFTVLFLIANLFNANVFAQKVTLCIKGHVVYVDDHGNLLGGNIALEDTLTGTITYDLSTPEDNSHGNTVPEVGDYYHYSSPNGMVVKINNYKFKTDPSNVEFLVEILDNHMTTTLDSTYAEDAIVFRSYKNVFSSSLGSFESTHIAWQLVETTHTALSSLIPPTSIDLSKWPLTGNGIFGFTIEGRSMEVGMGGDFFIRVYITSVTACELEENHEDDNDDDDNQGENDDEDSDDQVHHTSQTPELTACPNPAVDFFTLEAEEGLVGSEYIVLNHCGKKILTGTIAEKKTTIDISTLPKGQYFILTSESSKSRFRIIKN